jgi:methylmalonyl-CoA/ethylmalonyl-CoA epimerase
MFNIHHVGIVVAQLDEAVAVYCRLLNYPPDKVEYHDVPSEKVRVAMFKGNTTIELLEPTAPDTGLAKFLEKRGAGVHHLCYAVPAPLQDKLHVLKAAGFTLLDEAPRQGAEGPVFFVHPKSAGGMLVEFIEAPTGTAG